MKNLQVWMERFTVELETAIRTNPDEYCYGVEKIPEVCQRMQGAFERGSYNKDGAAIKACCKAFGIKHTYTAINTFLNG